jgi:hypothetical protein
VRGLERIGDLNGQFQNPIRFKQPAGDVLPQRLPLEQFHDDEEPAEGITDIVNGADVGMVQRRRGARFALEALERLRILRHLFRKELERDHAAEPRVLGFVDRTHPSGPNLFDNAIMGKALANLEHSEPPMTAGMAAIIGRRMHLEKTKSQSVSTRDCPPQYPLASRSRAESLQCIDVPNHNGCEMNDATDESTGIFSSECDPKSSVH